MCECFFRNAAAHEDVEVLCPAKMVTSFPVIPLKHLPVPELTCPKELCQGLLTSNSGPED